MIKSGAHRINPGEIEEVLLELPEIEEAAVVGRPDEFLGEAVVAHVTLRPGSAADPDSIRSSCRGSLPDHKLPTEVRLRSSMPRTPSGKIDKRALRGETDD
jgi:long-chain acyl-CoA synthetase